MFQLWAGSALAITLNALLVSSSLLHARATSRSRTCVVKPSNGTSDDSVAAAAAFADCSNDAVIIFSPSVEYNIYSPLIATNLSNVEISVQGNLHLPQSLTAVQ